MRLAKYRVLFLTLVNLGGQVLADLSKCPLLPELVNGYYEQVSHTKIKAYCNQGYFRAGKQFLRCIDGQWSYPNPPYCTKPENECPPPPKLDNGQLLTSGTKIGTTILYACNEGFFMIGKNKRTCTEQLYWSGVLPNCQPKYRKPEEMVDMLKHHVDTNITALNSTGSRYRILGPEIYELGLELFFLMDRSSSVDPIDFQSAKNFVIKLVKIFKGNENRENGTRVSVISFGSLVNVEIDLANATYNSVNATVARIEQIQGEGGGTAMQPAFLKVFDSLESLRPKAKKALFLLTDGEPNIYTGKGEPEEFAAILRTKGFEIYSIGVGQDIGRDRLVKIASEPAINHVFILDKYSKFDQVLDYIQNPLTTTPPPPPPGPDACGYLGDEQSEAKYKTKSRPHPWMAAIYVYPSNKPVKFCSGVIISDQWILTCGICVQQHRRNTTNAPHIAVVLGTGKLSSSGVNFYATNFTLSPLQHPKLLPELRLALIKLDRKIPMDDGDLRPVCLPNLKGVDLPHKDEASPMTTIEGWGSMANHKANKTLALGASYVSPVSRRIEVDKFNEELDCEKFLVRKYKHEHEKNGFNVRAVADKFLCVGNRDEGLNVVRRLPSVCSGNFGSPLVTKDEKTERYTLLGIQSSQFGCSDYKSHFLVVENYITWIDKTTGGVNQL